MPNKPSHEGFEKPCQPGQFLLNPHDCLKKAARGSLGTRLGKPQVFFLHSVIELSSYSHSPFMFEQNKEVFLVTLCRSGFRHVLRPSNQLISVEPLPDNNIFLGSLPRTVVVNSLGSPQISVLVSTSFTGYSVLCLFCLTGG